jgi:hypothetical protein
MPWLPFTLIYQQQSLSVVALVDSGAAISVVPWSVGMSLGARWEDQTVSLPLTGAFSSVEARGLAAIAIIGNLPPTQLAFAWAKSDAVPFVLGQVNFFMEFDICFFQSRLLFEIAPKRP